MSPFNAGFARERLLEGRDQDAGDCRHRDQEHGHPQEVAMGAGHGACLQGMPRPFRPVPEVGTASGPAGEPKSGMCDVSMHVRDRFRALSRDDRTRRVR